MNESTDKYSTPGDVLKVISEIEKSLLPRSVDRALINNQFNGSRPFTPEEEEEHQIQVNANFLEGYKIAQNAVTQMNGALLYKDRFFNARCNGGKATKRREWGEYFTANIHKPLKRKKSGRKFNHLMQNRNAALVLHGVGPLHWKNDHSWMPTFVGLDDLLIPTDTPLEMSDELGHFGVNTWITAWQLYSNSQLETTPGWNKPLAMKVLQALLTSRNFTPDYFNDFGAPEKQESLWKQRSAYLNSDAIPKVKLTTFYHQDQETGEWWRKVLVRENQAISVQAINPDEFLFEGKTTFAESIERVLHIQFGDGSVVAPFKYRSVRGLGVLLYSVIELMNRLRCQFTQHVFANLVPLLRVENPQDQDRPKLLQMQPYAVVEQGVSFVKQDERHQIDPRLVETNMNEFRQLMTESSASYVQDIDNGTGREQTLGEAQIKLQSANRIVAGMLQGAYIQEEFLYEEIIRRFLNATNDEPEAVKFRADCRRDGIPDDLMADPDNWIVELTKAAGSGDQTLAKQEVAALMQIAPQLDPTSQRKVRRDFISVMTGNPDKANDLVPEEQPTVTSGRKAAEDVFGTLMQGAPVGVREGIEQRDYVAAMLSMMEAVVTRIHQTDDVGTPMDVIGLNAAASDVEQHIQILAQDPNEKEAVTAAGKELGKMMNDVKAFQQRQEEAAKSKQQDPEVMAQLEMDKVAAAQKMHISEQANAQKMQQKEQAFNQKLEMDIQKHSLQMQQMQLDNQAAMQQAQADAQAQSLKTSSEIAAMRAKAETEITLMLQKASTEIETMRAKATAEISNSKKMADAKPSAPAE